MQSTINCIKEKNGVQLAWNKKVFFGYETPFVDIVYIRVHYFAHAGLQWKQYGSAEQYLQVLYVILFFNSIHDSTYVKDYSTGTLHSMYIVVIKCYKPTEPCKIKCYWENVWSSIKL